MGGKLLHTQFIIDFPVSYIDVNHLPFLSDSYFAAFLTKVEMLRAVV